MTRRTIRLAYLTPQERTARTFTTQLFLDILIAVGGIGGIELFTQLATGDSIGYKAIILGFVMLIAKTAATTALKFQNAKAEEMYTHLRESLE